MIEEAPPPRGPVTTTLTGRCRECDDWTVIAPDMTTGTVRVAGRLVGVGEEADCPGRSTATDARERRAARWTEYHRAARGLMAVYGRPQSVSLDLVLEARVRSHAERAEVTVSALIREAVGRYLDDVERRGVDAADDGS